MWRGKSDGVLGIELSLHKTACAAIKGLRLRSKNLDVVSRVTVCKAEEGVVYVEVELEVARGSNKH
jgi:hypothetical protein